MLTIEAIDQLDWSTENSGLQSHQTWLQHAAAKFGLAVPDVVPQMPHVGAVVHRMSSDFKAEPEDPALDSSILLN